MYIIFVELNMTLSISLGTNEKRRISGLLSKVKTVCLQTEHRVFTGFPKVLQSNRFLFTVNVAFSLQSQLQKFTNLHRYNEILYSLVFQVLRFSCMNAVWLQPQRALPIWSYAGRSFGTCTSTCPSGLSIELEIENKFNLKLTFN